MLGATSETAPRKETARITILPQPIVRPAPAIVNMAQTQPPLTTLTPTPPPSATIPGAGSAQPSSPTGAFQMFDMVPLPICWTIFAISTVTLLIQIWNYFSP